MQNPIEFYRKKHKISRRGVAKGAKISEAAIREVGHGMFVSIPSGIHEYFSELVHNYDRSRVNKDYLMYMRTKRFLIAEGRGPIQLTQVNVTITEDEHPLKTYIKSLNTSYTSFCQYLSIPKNSFFRYVTGKQREMPGGIKSILYESGMDVKDIQKLDTLGKEYYDLIHGR